MCMKHLLVSLGQKSRHDLPDSSVSESAGYNQVLAGALVILGSRWASIFKLTPMVIGGFQFCTGC